MLGMKKDEEAHENEEAHEKSGAFGDDAHEE